MQELVWGNVLTSQLEIRIPYGILIFMTHWKDGVTMFLHGHRKQMYCFAVYIMYSCILILSLVLPVRAAVSTEEYEKLPQSRIQSLLETINLQVKKGEPLRRRIDCFAAQGNQYYALGFYKRILESVSWITVYNGEGEYLYSISLETSGTFVLAWSDDNNLLVYFNRSDGLILEITTDGQCRMLYDASNVINHKEPFYKSKINAIGKAETIEDAGYFYRVNQITVERTNPDGTSVLLYKAPIIFKFTPIISVILFFVIFIIVLHTNITKARKKKSNPK